MNNIFLLLAAVFFWANYVTPEKYSLHPNKIEEEDSIQPNSFGLPDEIPESDPKVSKVLKIGDGQKAWVIDDAMTFFQKDAFNQLYQSRTYPIGFTFMHENYSKVDLGQEFKYGSSPWTRPLNMSLVTDMSMWKNLKPIVESLLKHEVKIQYGDYNLIRALDALVPHVNQFCDENRYVLTIFFSSLWRLNNYGQMSFYSKMHNPNVTSSSRLEITETVHPHEYRAVLWPSCHTHMIRGPCVNYFQHLYFANLYLTSKDNPAKDIIVSEHIMKSAVDEAASFPNFSFPKSESRGPIDFKKHLTRTFFDETEDRPIHVFDGLFTKEELNAWLYHLLQVKGAVNPFDSAPLEDHDNVQWMSTYSVDDFKKTPMWPRYQDLLKFISNENEWQPYDVALNYIRSADHTRIHPDSELHQIEFTLLLYLNDGLNANDYGETIFVKRKNKGDNFHMYIGEGGEVFETIAAVAPKFGRLAVFRNNIEHAAHSPSTLFLGGRYTFAVKVSQNERLANVKRTYEAMEGVDKTPILERVNEQLQLGRHDKAESSTITDKQMKQLRIRIATLSKKSLKKAYNEQIETVYMV